MKNPLVVGYKGEIGSFILNGLLRIMPKALDIWCVDINENDVEVTARIAAADVIFLCIPVDLTLKWLHKNYALLRGKIVLEQCSLKEWIYSDDVVKDLDVRSMHIMFRPSQTPNLDDRKLGLLNGQYNDHRLVTQLQMITQAQIIWYSDATHHDHEMAIQQALVHRTILVLGNLLDRCSGSTYVSRKIVELRDRILQGDQKLYTWIQDNKHLHVYREELQSALSTFDIKDHFDRVDNDVQSDDKYDKEVKT